MAGPLNDLWVREGEAGGQLKPSVVDNLCGGVWLWVPPRTLNVLSFQRTLMGMRIKKPSGHEWGNGCSSVKSVYDYFASASHQGKGRGAVGPCEVLAARSAAEPAGSPTLLILATRYAPHHVV